MAVATRIQPIEQTLRLVVDHAISPRAQSTAVAAYARQALKDAQAQNQRALGRVPAHRQFVDGSEGKPLDQVRADGGRIVFTFEIATDIATFILAELQRVSPVDSGDYKASHKLFADGREVAPGEDVSGAEELIFLNPLPYSRKIELGVMTMRVPGTDAVFQQATRAAQRRFGNVASIRFSYRASIGGGTRKAASASRVPAIVVTMR